MLTGDGDGDGEGAGDGDGEGDGEGAGASGTLTRMIAGAEPIAESGPLAGDRTSRSTR